MNGVVKKAHKHCRDKRTTGERKRYQGPDYQDPQVRPLVL